MGRSCEGDAGRKPTGPPASKMTPGLRTASGTGSALCREVFSSVSVTSHPGRTYGWAQGPWGVAGCGHGFCQKGDDESLDQRVSPCLCSVSTGRRRWAARPRRHGAPHGDQMQARVRLSAFHVLGWS